MKTVINIKTEKETYFSVTPKITNYLEKVLKQAKNDYKNHKNISLAFSSAKGAIDYLHSK